MCVCDLSAVVRKQYHLCVCVYDLSAVVQKQYHLCVCVCVHFQEAQVRIDRENWIKKIDGGRETSMLPQLG